MEIGHCCSDNDKKHKGNNHSHESQESLDKRKVVGGSTSYGHGANLGS